MWYGCIAPPRENMRSMVLLRWRTGLSCPMLFVSVRRSLEVPFDQWNHPSACPCVGWNHPCHRACCAATAAPHSVPSDCLSHPELLRLRSNARSWARKPSFSCSWPRNRVRGYSGSYEPARPYSRGALCANREPPVSKLSTRSE